MEENINKLRFSITVPFTNPVIEQTRKKQNIVCATLWFVFAFLFAIFMILSSNAENSSVGLVVGFGVFVAIGIICGVIFLFKIFKNDNDNLKEYLFNFYDISLDISQEDKTKRKSKSLTRCLYRKYKNKQYVNKVFECSNRFEISVFTGTYNGIPQFKKYILPRDVIKAEELETFKNFLKENFAQDYVIKQK